MNVRLTTGVLCVSILLGCGGDDADPAGDTDAASTGGATETDSAGSTSGAATSSDPSTSVATETSTGVASMTMAVSSGDEATNTETGAMICPDVDEPCTACESTNCADDYCNCFNNGSCVLLAQCTAQCDVGDVACNQECWTDFPEGISDGALLTHCAATVCTDACGPFVPLTPCQQCLYAECPTQMNVCVANPECTELLECLAACDEAGCENTCYTVHQGGLADSGPVGDCAQESCTQECA